MAVKHLRICHVVAVPFGHLTLRLAAFDDGSRSWSFRPRDFGPETPPIVNGSLDGLDLDSLIADFEACLLGLRQFREGVEMRFAEHVAERGEGQV